MNKETTPHLDPAAFVLPPAVNRVQSLALMVGGVAAAACLLGLYLSPAYFFRAYLVGWVYCVGITLGCVALSMINHLTHGAWGLLMRRVTEAAGRTLPLLFVLLIPLVAFGMQDLYEWARPGAMNGDEVLAAKQAYLNVPAFILRQIVYFAVWGIIAFLLSRLSQRQDQGDDPSVTRRMQTIAGPGIIIYALLVTFASVDWLMSLEPHWYSTIYGIYMIGSQGLSGFAFMILAALYLSRNGPLTDVIQPRHFHDWGKLMFAFVMLWAYFCYSQFLITWAGNLPEEIQWYQHRLSHGWQYVALALVVFHFALPFSLLLSRDRKRSGVRLGRIAALMLVMRWLDLVWQVEPAFVHEHRPALYWMYLAAPLALGGFWLWYLIRLLKARPLLPVNDPYLADVFAPMSEGKEALAHE